MSFYVNYEKWHISTKHDICYHAGDQAAPYQNEMGLMCDAMTADFQAVISSMAAAPEPVDTHQVKEVFLINVSQSGVKAP